MKFLSLILILFIFKVIKGEKQPCIIKNGRLQSNYKAGDQGSKGGSLVSHRSLNAGGYPGSQYWPGTVPRGEPQYWFSDGFIWCPDRNSWIPSGPWLEGAVAVNGCVWVPKGWQWGGGLGGPCHCDNQVYCNCVEIKVSGPCTCVGISVGIPCDCGQVGGDGGGGGVYWPGYENLPQCGQHQPQKIQQINYGK